MAGSLGAQAPGLSLQIETETGRTQFRMGEVISLKVTFENSSQDPWRMSLGGRDRSAMGLGRDRFIAVPSAGTDDPLSYHLSEGVTGFGLSGMTSRQQTTLLHADLNQWVRFLRPGYYRVHGLFHASPGFIPGVNRPDVALESNEIGIEIVPADAKWQAEQLREAVAILNSVPANPDDQTFEARMDAARRIWYLDTPDSVREATRLLGTADSQVSYILQTGLRASGHRDEAVAAMKQLLRKADQPVTPIFLETMAALEAAPETPRRRYDARARIAEQLRAELASVIEQKRASAKAISIKTLLDNLPAEAVPATLRAEIARLFQDLPAGQQSELLNGQWKKIAGAEMIPALRQIYDAAPQTIYQASPLVPIAVERWYELDPVQGRTLLLDEMSRPVPRLPFRTLAILPDATLPAMDQLFLEHLEHNTESEELIARYATPAILEPVKAFYVKRDAAMRSRTLPNVPNVASPACDPPLVAYFLRADPVWGEHLLRELFAERGFPGGRCWMGIVGQTAAYYVSPEWEKVAVMALQDQTVPVKADAVKALGKYGSGASANAVREAFRYWHEWWKDRVPEFNDENRRLEQAFLESIAHAKNGNITPGDLDKAGEFCITADCSQRALEYRQQLQQNQPF